MKCVLDRIEVNYEVRGEGRPIVMLHGWPLDHRYMVYTFEPLFFVQPGWRRIYLDLPGMGQTPGADWIRTQDDMLEVVLQFIDHVLPGEPYALVGQSYGAHLARGVVYHRPDDLLGVMLWVPVIHIDKSKRDLPSHTVLLTDPAITNRLTPAERDTFETIVVAQDETVLATLRAVIGPAVQAADQAFLERLELHWQFSFPVDDPPKALAQPSLIVAGRQDSTVGYRDIWEVIENFPRATFAVLDQSGHLLGGGEQNGLFRALVLEWTDRMEEIQ